MKATVKFANDNKSSVIVSNAKTMDEAVVAADAFLEEFESCVKNGGSFYGSPEEVNEDVEFSIY